jgi:hypothetical protein
MADKSDSNIPELINFQQALDLIEATEDPILHEMLGRYLSMLLVNISNNEFQETYRSMVQGQFDVYLYIYLVRQLLINKPLLREYIEGKLTDDTAW